MEDSFLSHPVLQGELDNQKNGDSAHKHLKQQVAWRKITGTHTSTHTRLTCQVCSVLYLRTPGGAGAAGTGTMLCGVRCGTRETVSLDPRSPEDPGAHGDPAGPAAAPGGALQHPLQGRDNDQPPGPDQYDQYDH